MLDTLIKIGKWQAEGMKPIERFLVKPKTDDNKTYYVLNLVFDLDKQDIYTETLKKYSEKDVIDYLLLKTKPGNNKAIYTTVKNEKKKIEGLLKSFFGKMDKKELENAEHGELYFKAKDIGTDDNFLELLTEITKLKNVLIDKIKEEKDPSKLNPKRLIPKIKGGEDFAMIVASVKSRDFNYEEPKPVAQIESYKQFIDKNFLEESSMKKNSGEKLCYATGELKNKVVNFELEERKSLNKMFGAKTYLNYAQNFNLKAYHKNYQVDEEIQEYLDVGSKYLINREQIRIAGVYHIIIPTFLSKTNIDFDMIFDKTMSRSDILFKHKEIKGIHTDISDEIDDNLYWLNFLSYTTDGGQTFKTTNTIKDISVPYFITIINNLDKLNDFLQAQYASSTFYNFYHFFHYIPVKKDVNNNEALEIFKDIFEHRKIDKDILFKHFTRYMIVQRSGQFDSKGYHRSFNNIRQNKEFDYAIKNGIMTYLVFLKFLRLTNLLNNNDMEENIENLKPIEEVKHDYAKSIEKFFVDMNYNDIQKALFYLGRVLNQVAYAQYNKGHKNKPVLNKLNYNGMDNDAIMRLRLDLAEKAKQYSIVNQVEYNFARFTNLFNPNNPEKRLTNEENVFYILSGYSFGMIKDKENNDDTEQSEN